MMKFPMTWLMEKAGSAFNRQNPRRRHNLICDMYDSVYGDLARLDDV